MLQPYNGLLAYDFSNAHKNIYVKLNAFNGILKLSKFKSFRNTVPSYIITLQRTIAELHWALITSN